MTDLSTSGQATPGEACANSDGLRGDDRLIACQISSPSPKQRSSPDALRDRSERDAPLTVSGFTVEQCPPAVHRAVIVRFPGAFIDPTLGRAANRAGQVVIDFPIITVRRTPTEKRLHAGSLVQTGHRHARQAPVPPTVASPDGDSVSG
jgi:hypothetical protein